MFKCKDCNTEYSTKPDYCDCGSDDFEEVTEIVFDSPPSEQRVEMPKIKRSFSPQEITSYAIFVLCLIFALVPWLIRVKEAPVKNAPAKIVQSSAKIPDINSIWKNSPSAPIQTPAAPVNAIPEPSVVQTIVKVVPKQTSQSSAHVKTAPKSSDKITKPNISTSPAKPKQTGANPREMYNYKRALASALVSRLNVIAIQGAGDCAVEFSVDTNGKLKNRGFAYQSDNKSMNDQVYYMLMRLPSFKSPPAGYNGQKFKLKFTVNNGDYNVTFIN